MAGKFILENGEELTQQTENNGAITRPELAIEKAAFADVSTLLAQFGFTPASRAKLGTTKKPDNPIDAFRRTKPK